MPYLPQLSFQPYIQSPDLQPVKEISDLGQSLNQRYDDNIAKYDALDQYMNQIQVNDSDSHLKDQLLNDTRGAIANIAKNGDWENAKTPIREVARRLNNDPIIKKAQQNYLTAQELDKQRLKAAEEGKPLIQFNDYHNFSTIDPDTGKARDLPINGVYEQKLDHLGKMREMFQDVNPDSYAYKNSRPTKDEDTGQIYSVGEGGSRRWLSKDKLKEVANRSFSNFLNTSEGQQRLKVLTTTNSENHTPLSTVDALNTMKTELLNVGLNKAFSDVSEEHNKKLAPGQGKGKAKDTSGEYRLTQDNAYQQNQDLGSLIDGLDKKLRTTGTEKAAANYAAFGVGTLDANGRKFFSDNPNKGYAVPTGMKDTYDSLFKLYSSGLGTKDPDKVNPKIQEYLKNVQNGKIEPKYYAYNTEKRINEENGFLRNGNLDGRLFLDPDTHAVLTWQQIKDKYKNEENNKISDKDLKDAKVSGEYSEDNPFVEMTGNARFASPQKFTIGGHKFILGSDEQEYNGPTFAIKQMTNGITRATRTGLPVKFNRGLAIVPKDNGYFIQDNNGQLRGNKDGTPFSLEDAQKLMYSTGNVIPQ